MLLDHYTSMWEGLFLPLPLPVPFPLPVSLFLIKLLRKILTEYGSGASNGKRCSLHTAVDLPDSVTTFGGSVSDA